jgi:phenylacetate-CoA ligase
MVNPLLNPKNSLPLVKAYFMDSGRQKNYSYKQMEKYRDKALKKIVKYAYTIPMYHDKYRQNGIHPSDIKGIRDIEKLPMISKNDLRENYPNRLLPIGYNKDKAFVICTGGTTGKSVSIYTDIFTMGKLVGLAMREVKPFGLNIRKSRSVHIGNFNENRMDLVSQQNLLKPVKSFISFNILNIDVNTPAKEIIEKLDSFKPDIILSYPAVLQHLAYIMRKGYGKNIKPKVLYCGGAMLDDYTRRYVQDTFGCPLLNTYQAVEAQGIIATECTHGTWHVHHDFYNVEVIDANGELVDPGKRGHLLLTRLFGRGTPIIRYNGMDDWVKILPYQECECGLSTPVIKDGVEGRKRANIVLPDGKVFPPGAFCFIEPVLVKHNTYKVKQYQVIQKKIDEIEVLLVIDESLRNEGVSVDQIKKEILEIYQKKAGSGVNISVIEVEEIKHPTDANKPAPIVISHVSQKEGYKVLN